MSGQARNGYAILSHIRLSLSKRCRFMLKPVFFGQFEDLKGNLWGSSTALGQKRKIKSPYRVEDEAELPKSPHYQITSSKTHAGPEDACESCADSATTVNVHRLAAYWPPWLTEYLNWKQWGWAMPNPFCSRLSVIKHVERIYYDEKIKRTSTNTVQRNISTVWLYPINNLALYQPRP